MYKDPLEKALNPTVTKMIVDAPLVAAKAQPGQLLSSAPPKTASASRSP